MAFPNTSVTDIIATTLEHRNKKLADNVTKNNAILAWLADKGNIKTCSGGRLIYEEIIFAENANGGYYSGYDILPTGPSDVISAAQFDWKQIAVPVVASGLETEVQNQGEEALIDLLEGRIKAGYATMNNIVAEGLYSDGTGSGGKQITGLNAAVPQDPTTGTYGNINRATASNAFWRSQIHDPGSTPTTSTIQAEMNTLWAKCVRGNDSPKLILSGATIWATWMGSLQLIQRFAEPAKAKLGFPTTTYMNADVVLDGGIGGFATATDMYFLNTDYLYWRPSSRRNMVPLAKRSAYNQDASSVILAFAGNLTCSGARFQGRGKFD